jgi:hypothetical protein
MCDHVQQHNHTSGVLAFSGGGAGKHGDGTYTAVQASALGHTNRGALDIEVGVAKRNLVQGFDDLVDVLGAAVNILHESDTLEMLAVS